MDYLELLDIVGRKKILGNLMASTESARSSSQEPSCGRFQMKSPWFEHVVNGTKTVFATVNLLTTQRFQVDDILTIVETDEHRVETGLNVHVKITAPPRRYRSIEQFLDAELARAFPGLDAQQAKDTQYYQIPPKLRDTYYQKGLIVFSVVPISKPWKPFRS